MCYSAFARHIVLFMLRSSLDSFSPLLSCVHKSIDCRLFMYHTSFAFEDRCCSESICFLLALGFFRELPVHVSHLFQFLNMLYN